MALTATRLWSPRRRLLQRRKRRLRLLRLAGQRKKRARASRTSQGLSETMRRNIALEAVKLGNYYSEDQEEVLRYIAEIHAGLLADATWLAKTSKLRKENGLTRLYTAEQILRKQPEVDGYNVFVDPDEAIFLKEKEEKEAAGQSAAAFLDGARAAEAQQEINLVVEAARGGEPVDSDEVLELLTQVAAAGEMEAAVFLGERLEAIYDGKLHGPVLDRCFQALKPLLRPNTVNPSPRLQGPWREVAAGKTGPPNPRKSFGKLLQRLAEARQADKPAEEAEAQAAKAAKGQEAMKRLVEALLPFLAKDAEASTARRRGELASSLVRAGGSHGLQISMSLAQALLSEMEAAGQLEVQGRDVALQSTSREGFPERLADCAGDLPFLEALAKERMDRRRKRQQARDRTKAAKKQRQSG